MRTVTYARYTVYDSITGERLNAWDGKLWNLVERLIPQFKAPCITLSFIALLGIVQPKVYLSWHLSIDLFPFPRAKFESNYTLPPSRIGRETAELVYVRKVSHYEKTGLLSHNRFYWTWHTAGWMEGRNLIITTGFRFIDIISLRRL
jgi:hypothetical protein